MGPLPWAKRSFWPDRAASLRIVSCCLDRLVDRLRWAAASTMHVISKQCCLCAARESLISLRVTDRTTEVCHGSCNYFRVFRAARQKIFFIFFSMCSAQLGRCRTRPRGSGGWWKDLQSGEFPRAYYLYCITVRIGLLSSPLLCLNILKIDTKNKNK